MKTIRKTMKTGFFLMITGLLLTACGNDKKDYAIGIVNLAPNLERVVTGFKDGMAELGYIENENTTYIYDGATNSIEALDSAVVKLLSADIDMILSVSTPATQAAQRATAGTDIPVVFAPLTDPVGAGIVKSIKNPGGNITGITFGVQEWRRLGWLLQIVPTIKVIYVPYNSFDQSALLALQMVTEAAATLGIKLISHGFNNLEEIPDAVENIPEEADAIFFLPDSLVSRYVPEFARLGLPTSLADTTNMEALDTLSSFGLEFHSAGRQAARLADQIFHGVKPADLPVETAELYLAINLKAAEAIGIDIPDEILRQADIIVR